MSHVLAIDQGTTSSRAIVFDARHGHRRGGAGGVPAALPAVGLGRARPGRHLVDVAATCRAAIERAGLAPGATSPPSASPTSARRRWSGTARPAGRSAAPSSGRTAAPARSAPSCAPPATRRWSPRRTGLLLDPYFSGTKLKWLLDAHEGARARARRGELLFGTVDSCADLEADRRRGACDRRHQRGAHAALQHPRGRLGPGDLRRSSTCPLAMLPEVRDCAADFGVTRADLFGRAIPIIGVAGDQQAATVGQACFAPGHAEGDLRHRLLRGAQHRRHAGGEPQPAAHHDRLPARRQAHLCARRLDLHRRRGGAVAARRAEDHPQRRRRPRRSPRPPTRRSGSTSCPPSPGSARPTGTPTAAARSSGSPATPARPSSPARRWRASPTRPATSSRRCAPTGRTAGDTVLRVDGGMTANDWVLQGLADILGAPVDRPKVLETTALGAAWLAGCARGCIRGRTNSRAAGRSTAASSRRWTRACARSATPAGATRCAAR